MTLEAFDEDDKSIDFWRVYSVGGGKIEIEGQPSVAVQDVYPLNTFSEIKAYCDKTNMRLHEYVREVEGDEIFLYLSAVWETMKQAIERGLTTEGVLPGGLEVQRKAKILYNQRHIDESPETKHFVEYTLSCQYVFEDDRKTGDVNEDGVFEKISDCEALRGVIINSITLSNGDLDKSGTADVCDLVALALK